MQNAASMEKFSISAAIDKGFSLVKNDFWIFIGVFLTAWMLPAVPAFMLGVISGLQHGENSWLIGAVAGLFHMVLQFGLILGLIKFCLKKYDNQEVGFADLFSCFSPGLILNLIVASLIVGVIVSLGMILLIVPGIIWMIQFHFYSYALVDSNCGPMTSLKRSSQLTQGVKMKLLLFALAVFGINLLGIMCLGIGVLFTWPATFMASVAVYKELSATQPAAV